MARILSLKARQVLDSRGNPTVESEMRTPKGVFNAIVPSGASTGKHEAIELRDLGRSFNGKGVSKAVSNVNNTIAGKTVGKDFSSQIEFDLALLEVDRSKNKSRLGANAILSASMCFARALATEQGLELYESIALGAANKSFIMPIPQLNVINGGKHAGIENDLQEHMFVPAKFNSFSDALRAGVEAYSDLAMLLKKKFGPRATLLGDEGGFVPPIDSIEERLELMLKAISESGYSGKIMLGLDCASSEFYSSGKYVLGKKTYTQGYLVDYYTELVEKYKVVSIEDGMAEDDWEGWEQLNARLGNKIQIIGDDLLVTNVERMKIAAAKKACNALLLKINQIGTIAESMEAAKLAKASRWNVIVSHRSGETEDSFIADLCVGLSAGQSKFGAPARGERTAKYNRLLRIEEKLSEKGVAKFVGKNLFAG